MAVLGFRHKMRTTQLSSICRRGAMFFYNGTVVRELDVCGVVANAAPRHFYIYDFYGEAAVYKSPELAIQNGTHMLVLRPFVRQAKSRVEFFCKSASEVSLYEEMAFSLEVCALIESGCYLN